MKKIFAILLLLVLISSASAEMKMGEISEEQRNQIRGEVKTKANEGIKEALENASDRLEDELRDIEKMAANVQNQNKEMIKQKANLFGISEKIRENIQNKSNYMVQFSNGKYAAVKVMPETASETALERLRLKVCNVENNCTIELKEVGNQNISNNKSRAAYEVQVQKHYKLLGMFQIKAQNRVQVDAENGEVIKLEEPWWSFLASEN